MCSNVLNNYIYYIIFLFMFVLHWEKKNCKVLEFWGNYDGSKPGLVEEFYAFSAFYPAAICNLAISKNSERNKLFCNNFILL